MTMLTQLVATGGALPTYIEDVFSTWLYAGNGSTQTITNGIDLAGEGGLVWVKARSTTGNHRLFDTDRGVNKPIYSNLTNAQATEANTLTAFNANGFTLGSDAGVNQASQTWASWTFRKQPKFFDVVTFTSDGTSPNQRISHNLGSVPGCIMVKQTGGVSNWAVYHRSLTGPAPTDTPIRWRLQLNTTSAQLDTGAGYWGTSLPTSTDFGIDAAQITGTCVAYLFAHNAGGFGLTGADNVISCGSVTDNNRVELGYEPQFLLMKKVNGTGNWILADSMRGLTANTDVGHPTLFPNTSGAEASGARYANIDATGFTSNMGAPGTHIYIAIRRPMKTPTLGTEVFSPLLASNVTGTPLTTNFPVDLQISTTTAVGFPRYVIDRLRGVATSDTAVSTPLLYANLTNAEASNTAYTRDWKNTGYDIPGVWDSYSTVYWNFRRAPGFMDVVCYTANSSLNTSAPDSGLLVSHGLGVVPELIIIKDRIASAGTHSNWAVWYTGLATQYPNGRHILLNSSAATVAATTNTFFNGTGPTSTQFRVWNNGNNSTDGYVAYLFATLPGVSKVGSYTGTGTTQQINCGFTGGARFVLIKRTDSTGDWYAWDTVRGIVAGNDPYLLINSSTAQTTSTDYIDTYSAGFEISSTAPAAINASGGTFIFFAVA